MPTWLLWPDLLKGLCFAEDILKVPTLSFQIPLGYLKWNKRQEFSSLVLQYVVQVNSLSRVWLFLISWTVSYQDPLSMEFSRQEYWSGLPFLSPGDLPNLGFEPRSPTLQADTLPSLPPGKSPGEGKHYPLQYSGLENSMECIVHGVTKNQTKSDDWTTTTPKLHHLSEITTVFTWLCACSVAHSCQTLCSPVNCSP